MRTAVRILLGAAALVLFAALLPRRTLTDCGVSAAESSACATMRHLVEVQQAARTVVRFDRNCDGVPEHVGLADAASFGLLPPTLAHVDADGVVRRGGYHFVLYLPRRGGGFVRADAPGADVDPVRAAQAWRAYAWPVACSADRRPGWFGHLLGMRREPGVHTVYVVDETGDIRATSNRDHRYEGHRAPTADACDLDPDAWYIAG